MLVLRDRLMVGQRILDPFILVRVQVPQPSFGIALIEAIQNQNWVEALLFLALGALSLRADFKK